MVIDWTQIILAFIGFLGTVMTVVLVPYLKIKTTEKVRDNIDWWVQVAVVYVEKNFPDLGALKKEDVKNLVKKMGLNITDLQLDILIDEVVERIINKPYGELIKNEVK